jgi:hypothetical protein
MDVVVVVVGLVGLVLAVSGGLWVLVLAFRQSVLWGLGCLLIPGCAIVFVILYRGETVRPLVINLLGWLLVGVAAMLAPARQEQFDGTEIVPWSEGAVRDLTIAREVRVRLEVTNESSSAVDVYLVTAPGAEEYLDLVRDEYVGEIDPGRILTQRLGLRGTFTSPELILSAGDYALVLDNTDVVGYAAAEAGSAVTVRYRLVIEETSPP